MFSFGAVLYEMVTGRRAFAGSSTAETLAAVVREQPKAPSEVVAGVPKELDRLILRCLQKEPDRRFQHMVDVEGRAAGDQGGVGLTAGGSGGAGPRESPLLARGRRSRPCFSWPPRPGSGGVPARASFRRRGWCRSRPCAGEEMNPTFSPDGGQIAFAWNGEKGDNADIYLKMVGSPEVRRLTTDPARDVAPSWSPDGRQIAFLRLRPAVPRTLARRQLPGHDPPGFARRRVGPAAERFPGA